MHNPAWRPAQLHTERLASIQHHFIDERPAVRSTGKPRVIHTLPVHMAVAASASCQCTATALPVGCPNPAAEYTNVRRYGAPRLATGGHPTGAWSNEVRPRSHSGLCDSKSRGCPTGVYRYQKCFPRSRHVNLGCCSVVPATGISRTAVSNDWHRVSSTFLASIFMNSGICRPPGRILVRIWLVWPARFNGFGELVLYITNRRLLTHDIANSCCL